MIPRETDAVAYLAQADLLLMLAEMLGPPSGWTDENRSVSSEDLAVLVAGSGLDRFMGAEEPLRRAVENWRASELPIASAEYHRLFDGSPVCPINETGYVRRDKGAVLADIAGFYQAFGFDLSETFGEKHDHMVAELQFAALLLVLVGRAVEAGRTDQEQVARDALGSFLCDHLGQWIDAFASRLQVASQEALYCDVGDLTSAVWWMLKIAYAIDELDPVAEPLTEDSGTPYECGMCSAGDACTEPAG